MRFYIGALMLFVASSVFADQFSLELYSIPKQPQCQHLSASPGDIFKLSTHFRAGAKFEFAFETVDRDESLCLSFSEFSNSTLGEKKCVKAHESIGVTVTQPLWSFSEYVTYQNKKPGKLLFCIGQKIYY